MKSSATDWIVGYLREHFPLVYWHWLVIDEQEVIVGTMVRDSGEMLSAITAISLFSVGHVSKAVAESIGEAYYRDRERKL